MKDTTKSWFKGYWTATVLYAAAQLGVFGVCKVLPTYHEGSKVLETKVAQLWTERVVEKNGRPGLSYEDPLGSYTAFFPDEKLRDIVREEMVYCAQTSRYWSNALRAVDRNSDGEISAEEVRAAYPLSKQ